MSEDLDKVMDLINNDDITNYQISKDLNISKSKLSYLKSGRIKPENLTYETVAKLVDYYDKQETLADPDMKFKDLLAANHALIYDTSFDETDETTLQAKVVTTTMDEFFDYLDDKYPNISGHNEQIISDWSELLQQTDLGNEIFAERDYAKEHDDDYENKYFKEAVDYVNKYGAETYYNDMFEDDEGYWQVSVLDERDILNIVKSYDRFKF